MYLFKTFLYTPNTNNSHVGFAKLIYFSFAIPSQLEYEY